MDRYLEEWVYGVAGRTEYKKRLGEEYVGRLAADDRPSGSVNYGF